MQLEQWITLEFWNGLVRGHLPEMVLVLTAALVTLADRHVRRLVNQRTAKYNKALRFGIFLLVVSVGYAALALGFSWAVRAGLTFSGGAYMAPIAFAVLIVVAIEAQRQRQV